MITLIDKNSFFRKKNFFLSLPVILLSTLFLSYYIFNLKKISFVQDYQILFVTILVLIFISIIFFLFRVFKQVYILFSQSKLKVVGYQLHQRLALLLSAICLMPALVISAFSIITLNSALDGWFNKKISTAVSQSVEVANQYLIEHKNTMRGMVLDFANQLNTKAISFSSNEKKINEFLNLYVSKNNFAEAILIDSTRNILAYSKYSFKINYLDIPDKFFNKADNGDIVLENDEDTNKVKAFIKLNQFVDAYLLVSRFLDEKVLNALNKTSLAVLDYQKIELNKFDLKISFLLLFLLISFLLLLISLYVGLGLANRLISPIAELIFAAEEVGRGNLNFKIKNKSLLKNKVKELKRLGNAFNKMILDIKNSRSELIEANDQIDKRRQFSEAVLSGVYSGVIGLDNNLKINLPNVTAKNVLSISLDLHYNKYLGDVLPEFKPLLKKVKLNSQNFVEDKIEILRQDKKIILIARIVKQIKENKIIGYVVTFEDVTDLINAQKLAAWSDIARKIAHEIKNPLTPLKLGAERLKKLDLRKNTDKNKHNQTLDMILRQVDDIHHLINEFSSFARMPTLKLKKINLYNFLKSYFEPIKNVFPNVNFDFKNYIKDPIKILADEKQLRQVLTNIIKNSYESFDQNNLKNASINLAMAKENSFVKLTIIDNGSGIKNATNEKIMEPYYTTKKNGTGLGLAISKKIIEDHNGSIFISSLKKGTIVTLSFPLII